MANFLDMQCPKCGRDDGIEILASIWVRVTEDGTDSTATSSGDHEFDPTSRAECHACGYCGTVADFEPKEEA